MMSFYALDTAEQKNCLICGVVGGAGHHKGVPRFEDVDNPQIHDTGGYDEGQPSNASPSLPDDIKARAERQAADRADWTDPQAKEVAG